MPLLHRDAHAAADRRPPRADRVHAHAAAHAERPRRRPRLAADSHVPLVAEHRRRRRQVGVDRDAWRVPIDAARCPSSPPRPARAWRVSSNASIPLPNSGSLTFRTITPIRDAAEHGHRPDDRGRPWFLLTDRGRPPHPASPSPRSETATTAPALHQLDRRSRPPGGSRATGRRVAPNWFSTSERRRTSVAPPSCRPAAAVPVEVRWLYFADAQAVIAQAEGRKRDGETARIGAPALRIAAGSLGAGLAAGRPTSMTALK